MNVTMAEPLMTSSKATNHTLVETRPKYNATIFTSFISSLEQRDIHTFPPLFLCLQPHNLQYFKAGKAYFLYRLMSSAVDTWPEARPEDLTKIRAVMETKEVITALLKNMSQRATERAYFSAIGTMANGSNLMRERIRLYMNWLFKRLLSFLGPSFITIPSVETDAPHHRAKIVYIRPGWSSGCPATNWIASDIRRYLRVSPLQTPVLPSVSPEMVTVTEMYAGRRMQALELLGDRALEFLYELSLLTTCASIPEGIATKLRPIILSNKMFSVLAPFVGIDWYQALPQLVEPSGIQKIKLVADMFEARIGAIVAQPTGFSELEVWWSQNMPAVMQYTARLLEFFLDPDPRTIEQRKREDRDEGDAERGSAKRARYSAGDPSSSSLGRSRANDEKRGRRAYQAKENHHFPQSTSGGRSHRHYRR